MNRNIARAAGLAALVSIRAYAQEQPLTTSTTNVSYSGELGESPLNFFVKSTFVSKYRISAGFVLSDEPVNQTLFSVSKSNVFMENDVLDGYIWENTDLESGSLAEADFGADYTFPISDDFVGGKLGGYVELAHWEYPDGRLGDNDKGLITKLN